MRIRGFMWGNAQYVKLNGAQTGRLRNLCVEKIPELEFRRYWALCVAELHPDMPATMRPDVPDKFFFRKYRRTFVLELDLERDVWVLNVLGTPAEPPVGGANGGAGGDGPVPQGGGGRRGPAARRRTVARTLHFSSSEGVFSYLYKTWGRLASSGLVLLTIERANRIMLRLRESVNAALSDPRIVARLHQIVSLARYVSSLFTRVRELEGHATYGLHRLEQRRVEIAPGKLVSVNTFVAVRHDWESWLFGRLVEEEQLAG